MSADHNKKYKSGDKIVPNIIHNVELWASSKMKQKVAILKVKISFLIATL